jgi:hypothetical protein
MSTVETSTSTKCRRVIITTSTKFRQITMSTGIKFTATKLVKPPNIYSKSHLVPEQIRSLIVEKRRARARYQSSRLPSHKSAYNKFANSLKKVLAKHKTNEFEQKLQSLSSTDGSLWKETKRMLKYKSPSCPLKNANNTLAITDNEKSIVFQSHLSETFQPHNDFFIPQHLENVKIYVNSPLPYARPVKYFTPNEVKNMITKCSRKKSPVFDLITAEVARWLPKKSIVLLIYIYNAIIGLSYFPLIWEFSQIVMFAKQEKPPDIPNSYRPINLLPYLSKICKRLFLNGYLHIY